MKNELFVHDYIIALIEAAKRATRKLKKRKIRRVLESNGSSGAIGDAIWDYLGVEGTLKAIVKRVEELTGTSKTQELYELLKLLALSTDGAVKPENLYLLKPAFDAMQSFVEKCEELEKGQAGDQKTGRRELLALPPPRDNGQRAPLERLGEPTKEQCKELKGFFSKFIGKYELTKKDTPFYKRWYYWFMSLSKWERILIGFMFLAVVFIILFAVFKVGRKVFAALRRALNGDKTVGRKLVNAANNANPKIKNAAFVAVMDSMPKKAAMYF